MENALNFTRKLYYRVENNIFDWKHKVDTRGFKDLHEMDISFASIRNARRYEPSPICIFTKMMRKLPLTKPDFHFVDLGCGKGLTLLLASQLSFKSVTGIEFAKDLYLQAIKNVEQFQTINRLENEVNVLMQDFTLWQNRPVKDTIYFLYNPCDGDALRNFFNGFQTSLENVYVLYVNPLRGHIVQEFGFRIIEIYPHQNHNYVGHLYKFS